MSIGLLQQTITRYKICYAGGQAHYHSRPHWDIKTKASQGWLVEVSLFYRPSAGIIERLSLTLRGLTSNGKRQRWPLNLCSFLLILKSHKNRKMFPTIRHKYNYFHSTAQRAKERRQKFHFCRLPFDVRPRNVKLNLSDNELALQDGGFCTMWPFVAKGLFFFQASERTGFLNPRIWLANHAHVTGPAFYDTVPDFFSRSMLYLNFTPES